MCLLCSRLYICSGSPLWWLEWTRQGCCTDGPTWRPKGPHGGQRVHMEALNSQVSWMSEVFSYDADSIQVERIYVVV